MSRFFLGSAIAASLLLAGCSAAADQGGIPSAEQSLTSGAAAASAPPTIGISGDSPDPSAIVELPQPVTAAAPVTAEIPGIGQVPVVPVGVADGGQAEIPGDVGRIGWYRYGSAPGDADGSVVMVGHRDSRGGRGALFDLPLVPVGAVITVTDASGATFRYQVTANASISKQTVPLADLFIRDGAPRLVLISCGGPYVEARGYLENVVVTAARI